MLTIEKVDFGDDWYTLHEDGREAWSGGAIVEGSAAEWLEIAAAVERGESKGFRRCAACRREAGWEFSSPRNSDGSDSYLFDSEAKAFVASVRAVLIPYGQEI